MPRQYPEEFKKQITAICVAGTPLATISEKYHISLNTLYHWRKEYQQIDDQSTIKDYSTLCRQYERQNHILQIIRLSMSSLNSTASMNYVKLWTYPAAHSTITFFAEQIEQNTC